MEDSVLISDASDHFGFHLFKIGLYLDEPHGSAKYWCTVTYTVVVVLDDKNLKTDYTNPLHCQTLAFCRMQMQ